MSNHTDPDDFEALYRSYAPLGLQVAKKVLDDPAAAEDVVQDMFLQLWRNPGSFNPARGQMKSYVSMVARSRSIDRWRSRAAERAALERLATEARTSVRDSTDGADQRALDGERRRELLSAIVKLPSEQREAVVLAYCGGQTAREIADGADVPLGTAKSRIRLGLSRARGHLSEAA
ncbi:MAG: sigma-70 family RNA polymerase sigma factor [Solirubrobacterales bacterium]|nr:sigma-70 family RNA polymerase sigma factor [Solirubrobacterales bacterium]